MDIKKELEAVCPIIRSIIKREWKIRKIHSPFLLFRLNDDNRINVPLSLIPKNMLFSNIFGVGTTYYVLENDNPKFCHSFNIDMNIGTALIFLWILTFGENNFPKIFEKYTTNNDRYYLMLLKQDFFINICKSLKKYLFHCTENYANLTSENISFSLCKNSSLQFTVYCPNDIATLNLEDVYCEKPFIQWKSEVKLYYKKTGEIPACIIAKIVRDQNPTFRMFNKYDLFSVQGELKFIYLRYLFKTKGVTIREERVVFNSLS